jgi:TetR/AcrR family transcriptional regulator, regulator of cefoperazone and chloramphenicol sensitivity
MRSATAADLTAPARIRDTALRLFARHGVAGTSLRAVAREADVSPALVVHHFGTKQGLCAAVDEAVVRHFVERLSSVPLEGPELLHRRGEALADLIREEPLLCDYMSRALAEGTATSADLFHRLFAAARADAALVAAGAIRAGTDPEWRALQQLILVVGPLILRPLVERELGTSLYAPESVDRWMAANVDLLERGIYET